MQNSEREKTCFASGSSSEQTSRRVTAAARSELTRRRPSPSPAWSSQRQHPRHHPDRPPGQHLFQSLSCPTAGFWMSQPLPPPSTTKRSPPSRSSSPGTSHLPLHHSSSRSSLKSLGGPSKLRDQLLVPPPRSTSPKITDVGGGERDSHQTGVDRPPGATVSAAGPTDSRAGAVGWKHRGGDKGTSRPCFSLAPEFGRDP